MTCRSVSLAFSVQFNVQIIRIMAGLKSIGSLAGLSYLLSSVQVHMYGDKYSIINNTTFVYVVRLLCFTM